MTSARTARAAGMLIVAATLAGLLSVVPSVESQDYLAAASGHARQVMSGAFFQLVMAAAYVGFAILLHPILRKFGESLALGFVAFRIIAGAFLVLGVVPLLLLLALSQEFVRAGAADPSFFRTLGGLLRTGRDLVNHVAMILALSVGGLMFYAVLCRSRLVPRWLSGWGLAGTGLAMLASCLVMFRAVDVVSAPYLALNVPVALEEMVLAVLLLVKGFDPSALASVTSTRT